jgi:TatD DNase family protein
LKNDLETDMAMNLIDTHCHLDITSFMEDFANLYARARKAGVHGMVLPGVDRDGWPRMLELCAQHEGLFAAPGLHPLYMSLHHPQHLKELAGLTRTKTLYAIGEIGLDYFIKDYDAAAQQDLFEQQLKIAEEASLPILLHVRKAHDRVLKTLRAKRFSQGGIVHAFTGSLQQASQYVGLGFGISFCGTITYDRARKVRAIAAKLPQQAIVVETDAPDIPLAGRRGKPNLPEYLPEVVNVLAEIRNEPPEETAQYTTANARRLLRLPI